MGLTRTKIDPYALGWRIGTEKNTRQAMWNPYDVPTLVLGSSGCGKSLDLLLPAVMRHQGPALVTMTKVLDLMLILHARAEPLPGRQQRRKIVVLDPFGLAPGVDPFVMDVLSGCADPEIAERRAKAFAKGAIGSMGENQSDAAKQFYETQSSYVIMSYLHAAGLTGRTLDDVMGWVAEPSRWHEVRTILEKHPLAAHGWDARLRGALTGDPDTVGNTITTVNQAFDLFWQPRMRARCVPAPGSPATDVAQLIRDGATIVLLGRDDKYSNATPLMTAVAEHILDTARALATESPYERLVPPFLADLDELPSTAPVPSLAISMANDRALGICFILAGQTAHQLITAYGGEAKNVRGLAKNWIIFGGSKDDDFNDQVSRLLGTYEENRGHGVREYRVMPPEQVRMIPARHALLIADAAPPMIAKLERCIDGKAGQVLLAQQAEVKAYMTHMRGQVETPAELATRAVELAAEHGLDLTAYES